MNRRTWRFMIFLSVAFMIYLATESISYAHKHRHLFIRSIKGQHLDIAAIMASNAARMSLTENVDVV